MSHIITEEFEFPARPHTINHKGKLLQKFTNVIKAHPAAGLIAVFVAIGLAALSFARADTTSLQLEAETGQRSDHTLVTVGTSPEASGNSFVTFGQPGTPPPPQPTPPPPAGNSLLKPAASYTKLADLRYSNAGPRLLLDLYLPNHGDVKPLVIYVHGGGWSSGSKDQYCLPASVSGTIPTTQTFMNRGFAVACINYRYSTEATYPAQIEDVKASIRWLRANAAKYKLFDKIGIWGGSAGGHLSALAGTTGDVKEYDKGDHLQLSSRVQASVDDFGPTDLVKWAQTPGHESIQQRYSMVGQLLGGEVLKIQDKARAANPITYITADDPPFNILHGDKDPIVPLDQSQLLDTALKQTKVSSDFIIVPSPNHPPIQSYQPARLDKVAQFFDTYLR